jgi:tetratricopeptide (TPR) repeat protein
VPKVEKIRKPLNVKKIVIGLLISLGVLMIATGLWYAFLVPTPQEAADKANTLSFQGKFEEARSLMNLSQLKAFSQDDKLMLWGGLMSASMNLKDYKSAEKYMKLQEPYRKGSYEFIMSEGDFYQSSGDKKQAIAYYQKTIDLLKAQKSGIKTISVTYVENLIQELQK